MHTRYKELEHHTTKDGSEIRGLMHPTVHGCEQQSLAEARVPAGDTTALHRHQRSEELYHVTAGRGLMVLGERRFTIEPGDTVCIPPGTPHCVHNAGPAELVILCCCSPAYSHDDTELLTPLDPTCLLQADPDQENGA